MIDFGALGKIMEFLNSEEFKKQTSLAFERVARMDAQLLQIRAHCTVIEAKVNYLLLTADVDIKKLDADIKDQMGLGNRIEIKPTVEGTGNA